MNVLIVDDSEDVRSFLKQLLRDQGHVVREAVNGQEGLSRVREQRPDVIICDGLMPVMDGFQLLQTLKRDSSLSSIPFIFLSSVYTGQREQDLALSLGADAFLVKPQPPEAIVDALQAVTGGRDKTARPTSSVNEDDAFELAQEYSGVVAAALEKKVGELRTASDEWRTTFDAMTEAVALLDADGRIMRCNRAMATLAQKPFSQIIGQACTKMCACFGGSREECPFIKSKKTLKRETVVFKQGKQWFEVSADPIVDKTGALRGAVHILQEITERKHADEKLRKREAQLTESQRIAGIGSWERDLATNAVVWSKELFRIFGLDPERVASSYETLKDLIHPDDREAQMRTVQEAIQERKPYRTDFRIVRQDGTTAVIQSQGEVIYDEVGRPVLIRGTAQDITERRKAEESLRESEERYRNVIENAFDLVQSVSPEGRFLYVNPSWSRTMGFSLEELRDKTIFDIIHPSCKTKCTNVFSSMATGAALEHFETQFMAKDGRVIDIEGSATSRTVGGRVVSMQCLLHDVTERKKLQEQLFRTQQDWEYTFNSITDMVTVHDADYNIILANKAAQKILHLPILEMVKDRKCFSYYHGTDHAPEGCPSCGCLQTGAPAMFEIFEPHLNLFIEIRAIPRFDSNGTLIGLIHVVRDITERKQLEQQIKAHTEQLEAVVGERTRELEDANRELQTVNRELILRREEADTASRSKTDFLANMSHELRTPLNAIMGFSEIMLMGMAGPVSDKQQEFLNDISNSGKHLLSLINDILDLSKVEAGKMELEPEPVNIGELLDGSLMMFKEKALKHAISMRTDLEASLPEIIADRRKLKQVLVNLLSNAFKFTPDGGSVRVSAKIIRNSEFGIRNEDEKTIPQSAFGIPHLEVSVADTGAGITPEHQQKLFQPFQQIDSSLTRKHTGTGLGLSLCRRFVELHGGRIWVESDPGKGSTFRFAVPVGSGVKYKQQVAKQ